jgi:hypothetical protein
MEMLNNHLKGELYGYEERETEVKAVMQWERYIQIVCHRFASFNICFQL